MIIRSAAPPQDLTGPSYLGELCEAAGISCDLVNETHNLTLALLNFEHAASLSEATLAQAGAATREWFKRVAESIAKFWRNFVTWLKKLLASLAERVFGPRERWVSEHEDALGRKKGFGGAKVTLGSEVLSSSYNPTVMVASIYGVISEILDEAQAAGADGGPSFLERVERIIKSKFVEHAAAGSTVRQLEERFVGEMKEVELTPAVVRRLLSVAKKSAQARQDIAKMAELADTAKALASRIAGGDDLKSKEPLKNLVHAGPIVSGMVSACISVNSRVNSMVMQALAVAERSAED